MLKTAKEKEVKRDMITNAVTDDDIHHLLINVFYILSWRKLIIVTVASLSPVRGLAGVEVSAGDPEITEVSAWASRAAGDIKVVPPVWLSSWFNLP